MNSSIKLLGTFALGSAVTYAALSMVHTQHEGASEEGAGVKVLSAQPTSQSGNALALENDPVLVAQPELGSQAISADEVAKLVARNRVLEQQLAQLTQQNTQLNQQLVLEEQAQLDLQTELNRANKQVKSVRTGLQTKLTELHSQNHALTSRLEASVPKEQRDTHASLETLVPEAFKHSIARLPEKRKQEIVDFHEQQQVSDWGHITQQALTDFVTSHTLAQYVTLDSVICKQDACEVSLSETINKQVLAEQGLSREEIQHISQSETPKYRQIIDDIKADAVLNLRSAGGMHGRFNSYVFFKSK